MSRSKIKSTTKYGRFGNFVCYFSNKKSRTTANQKFRTKNKNHLKKLIKYLGSMPDYCQEIEYDDLPNIETTFLNKLRECSDVWDFASDGLKQYFKRYDKLCPGEEDWTDEEWEKFTRK